MTMKAFVNWQAFTQEIDSGSLGMLGMVIHRFDEPGDYQISIYQGERLDRTVRLKVNNEYKTMQLNMDLAAAQKRIDTECHCKGEDSGEVEMAPQGHIVFHVSDGLRGYRVSATKAEEKPIESFDSGKLDSGDIFVVHLIRPGTYSVTNVLSNARGKIVVSYPRVGSTRYTPPEALSIDLADTFIQDTIKVQPGQGQIYRIKDKSRIKIQLVEPDDGPSKKPGGISWKKLQPKSAGSKD